MPDFPDVDASKKDDRFPDWSVGTWVAVAVLAMSVCAAFAASAVTRSDVARHDQILADHEKRLSLDHDDVTTLKTKIDNIDAATKATAESVGRIESAVLKESK